MASTQEKKSAEGNAYLAGNTSTQDLSFQSSQGSTFPHLHLQALLLQLVLTELPKGDRSASALGIESRG